MPGHAPKDVLGRRVGASQPQRGRAVDEEWVALGLGHGGAIRQTETWESGSPIVLSQAFSKEVLSVPSETVVLVVFSAPWCGPCRLITPLVKDLYEQYKGSEALKVVEVRQSKLCSLFSARCPHAGRPQICTDDDAQLCANYDVASIPTLLLFRDQILLDSMVGAVSKEGLDAQLRKFMVPPPPGS